MLILADMTNEDVNARLDRIETLMESGFAESRRHMDVVAEGMRHEVHLIAEGHDVLRADVAELKGGVSRLEAGQERLEVRQSALEFRQARVEDGLSHVVERQDRLEERQSGLEGRQSALEDHQIELTTEVRLLIARTG